LEIFWSHAAPTVEKAGAKLAHDASLASWTFVLRIRAATSAKMASRRLEAVASPVPWISSTVAALAVIAGTRSWDRFASPAMVTAACPAVAAVIKDIAKLAPLVSHASTRILLVAAHANVDIRRLVRSASLATWIASTNVVLAVSGATRRLAHNASRAAGTRHISAVASATVAMPRLALAVSPAARST